MGSLIINSLHNNFWVRGWKVLRISQHLPKLCAIKYLFSYFMKHSVHVTLNRMCIYRTHCRGTLESLMCLRFTEADLITTYKQQQDLILLHLANWSSPIMQDSGWDNAMITVILSVSWLSAEVADAFGRNLHSQARDKSVIFLATLDSAYCIGI